MAHHRPNNLRKKRQELAEAFRVQEQPTGIIIVLGKALRSLPGGRLGLIGCRVFLFSDALGAHGRALDRPAGYRPNNSSSH